MASHIIKVLGILLLTILFHSCSIFDPSGETPSYIRIDTITFKLTDPSQGTASHKISDAWVYVDDNLVGAFELPVTLPVLAEGRRQVRVRAGIRINGIAATRTFYPFFTNHIEPINLKLKEITTVSPVVEYHPQTTFAWMSNFENELKIESLPNSKASMVRVTDPAVIDYSLNGNACGGIFLTESENFYSGASLLSEPLNLPTGGRNVYLEMNYKNNQKFAVGIIARNPEGDQGFSEFILNPTRNGEWNKIYINLTSVVSQNYEARGYYFYIVSEKDPEIPKGEIYVDNLKIVY
jgi:hypothetical protein